MAAPRIFLVAGETSGDHLGAGLMQALRAARPDVAFSGVGGEEMTRAGLSSLFPLADIAVMGLMPVLARLPTLLARIDATARAIVAAQPDCLVLIDAPDFTHRVARRVRRLAPQIPIIDYVSPTVWAWRPGRARKMRGYIDHVLAVLPFEPGALARLGGPTCSYVGHPLVERMEELVGVQSSVIPDARVVSDRQSRDAAHMPLDSRSGLRPVGNDVAESRSAVEASPPLLLVLPGSRVAEVSRLMPVYGEALALLARDHAFEAAIPVAPHVGEALREGLRRWSLQPRLIGQAEKFAAFRSARAALVTSGVATLELALAGAPMVVAYKVSRAESWLRFLVTVHSIVLPNLVLGENAVPEFLLEAATPRALADALAPLLAGGAAREAQCAAFARVRAKVMEAGRQPSAAAAEIVLRYAAGGRRGVEPEPL